MLKLNVLMFHGIIPKKEYKIQHLQTATTAPQAPPSLLLLLFSVHFCRRIFIIPICPKN